MFSLVLTRTTVILPQGTHISVSGSKLIPDPGSWHIVDLFIIHAITSVYQRFIRFRTTANRISKKKNYFLQIITESSCYRYLRTVCTDRKRRSDLLEKSFCTKHSLHSSVIAQTCGLKWSYRPLHVDHNLLRIPPSIICCADHPKCFHTHHFLYADPSKPSSKIEESVQALKEKNKSHESAEEVEKTIVSSKKTLKQKIIDECVHYYHGFRLLFIDISVSTKLLGRILRGIQLSRREHNLVG